MLDIPLKSGTVTPTQNVYKVVLAAEVPTPFAAVLGYPKMDITVEAESVHSSGDMEVALALDVTGLMAGAMDDLKRGAKGLAEALYGT